MNAPFDAAADTYDSDFDALPATARIRKIVQKTALRFFPPGGSLLELNCGTGTDAITLCQHGFRVLATDASPSMIRVASDKLATVPTNSGLEFRVLPFDQLKLLNGIEFDGIFSNMGGLNCLSDLRPLAMGLAGMLKPGAHVVATFLSDFCLWETGAFLLRFDFQGAFRRQFKNGGSVLIHGNPTKVHFYSPSEVERAFAPYFSRSFTLGLNVFTPPPSSTRAYHRLRKQLRVLNSIDDRISESPPFNRIGDHFVVVLRRTEFDRGWGFDPESR